MLLKCVCGVYLRRSEVETEGEVICSWLWLCGRVAGTLSPVLAGAKAMRRKKWNNFIGRPSMLAVSKTEIE